MSERGKAGRERAKQKERTKTRRGEKGEGGEIEKFAAGEFAKALARSLAVSLPGRSFVTCRAFNASRGKYRRCLESRRFYTESLYRGAIYHSFNARPRAARQDSNLSSSTRRCLSFPAFLSLPTHCISTRVDTRGTSRASE